MKKKKEEEENPLAKLMKLTKLMKEKKIRVASMSPMRSNNKWRSQEPKFAPKAVQSENVIKAGGMNVDPARAQEYENWRKDKLAEQEERRIQAKRYAEAARKARLARDKGSDL